jgi:hypothetical protein
MSAELEGAWRGLDQDPSLAQRYHLPIHWCSATAPELSKHPSKLRNYVAGLYRVADGPEHQLGCPVLGHAQGLAHVHHPNPATQLAAGYHIGRLYPLSSSYEHFSRNW